MTRHDRFLRNHIKGKIEGQRGRERHGQSYFDQKRKWFMSRRIRGSRLGHLGKIVGESSSHKSLALKLKEVQDRTNCRRESILHSFSPTRSIIAYFPM